MKETCSKMMSLAGSLSESAVPDALTFLSCNVSMRISHARGDVGRAPFISMPLEPLSSAALVRQLVRCLGLQPEHT